MPGGLGSVPSLGHVPSLEEALALPRTVAASVEPRFIDEMGHMNVAWYVHLFDLGTWAFFDVLGISGEYRRRAQTGMFAVEQHVRYLGELREGDPLEVHSRLLELKPKSLVLMHAMTDPVRERVAAVSEVVGVHIDLRTRRAAPFPDDLLASIRARLAGAPSAEG
jgi:acyl-CoA thioester hydrolase